MSALDRKLARDVRRLASQGVTIALVVACGIAAFTSLRTTYGSLIAARDTYYERERMPDLFVSVTRAPESLAPRIAAIRGVAAAETRIEGAVKVMLPGELDPPSGRILSIPDDGEPRLAGLVLRDCSELRRKRADFDTRELCAASTCRSSRMMSSGRQSGMPSRHTTASRASPRR